MTTGVERGLPLEAALRAAIQRDGPMTFAAFMERALYDPEHGYYRAGRRPIAAGGDYFTSPAAHPVFGALVARQLRQMWALMGRPDPFVVVEPGAGEGLLERAVREFARAVSPDFARALRYRTVEVGDAPGEGFEGCLLSNELFDALPFHRVQIEGGELREVYVDVEGDALVERLGPPSTPALAAYLDAVGVWPPEGSQAEINLAAAALMRRLAGRLRRGYALTFDYGYPAEELYGVHRARGTVLSYYRHTYNDEPLRRPGMQDITAHVDFTGLALAGAAEGLAAVALLRQREFLLNCGLEDYLRALAAVPFPVPAGVTGRRPGRPRGAAPAEAAHGSAREREANAYAARALVDPQGLGRFGVLVQAKGVPVEGLIGLEGERAAADFAVYLPLATEAHVPLYDAVAPAGPEMRWEDFLPPGTTFPWDTEADERP